MTSRRTRSVLRCAVTLALAAPGPIAGVPASSARAEGGPGAIELGPDFVDHFTVVDLGGPAMLPGPFGGIAIDPAAPDTLLIVGRATDPRAVIYAVDLERDFCGRIIGYGGAAVPRAAAPNADGGLAVVADGVILYTTFPTNLLGQIRPGSAAADRLDDLTALGVEPSTGGLGVVPPGLPGAGRLKLTSYDAGAWYDAALAADGAGTFEVQRVGEIVADLPGGPEGMAYVAAPWPGFETDGVLVARWDLARVDAYELDPDGNPRTETERPFLAAFNGAEGLTIDPVTGDVLVSSLGIIERVIVVRPRPACAADLAPEEGDGVVDFLDLLALLFAWGETCVSADLDGNGTVDFNDVLAMLRAWGAC